MTVASALGGFAVLALLLTIVPGLDTALVLRAAITQGRRNAVATAAGVNLGALIWGAAAAVGATALLAVSTVGYDVLRYAGAAYMIFLGAQMIARTLRRRAGAGSELDRAEAREPLRVSFLRGAGTNLLNPKVGVFYLAVIPQFLPAGADPLVMGLALAMLHNVISWGWFGAIILSVHAARRFLSRCSVHRWLDRVTGTVLIGFGIRLAVVRT